MVKHSETFRLIGFEAPADLETGICTALYAAHPLSNQVFLASPEIEGDRTSSIAFFEEVVPEQDIHYLMSEECREVSIGEPWRDAFLIRGKFCFGTTNELLAAIDSEGGLGSGFPLTALDLLSSQAGGKRKEALSTAYEFLNEKIGHKTAKRWLVETYLRGQILVNLRQDLSVVNASLSTLEALRQLHLTLDTESNLIAINLLHLPDGMASEELAVIKALTTNRAVTELLNELPLGRNKPSLVVNFGKPTVPKHYVPKPVLIVPYGPEAEKLAQHFQKTRQDQGFVVDRSWPGQMFDVWRDDAVDHLSTKELKGYSIVVAVVSERSEELRINPSLAALEEMLQHNDAPELIVAPILPPSRPSRHLSLDRQASLFDGSLGQTLLDTSFVRSPGWVGDHTKSLTRRLSDHIEKACLLLLSEPEVLDRVSNRKNRQTDGILCVYPSKLSKHVKSEFDYLSEAVAFSTLSEKRIARAFLEHRHSLSSKLARESGNYDVALRPMKPSNFEALAEQSWTMASKHFAPGFEVNSIENETNFPRSKQYIPYSKADLLLFSEPRKRRFIITAETPNLELIRYAEETGRQAMRYTDKHSLRRFSDTSREQLWDFEIPEDFQCSQRFPVVDHPPVFRRASNWDAQFLLAEAWRSWLDRYPDHPMRRVGKFVLPTGTRNANNVPTLVAISERELERVARTDDRGLEELSTLFVPQRSHGSTDVIIEPVLQNDLNADISRWVFRDGRFPIVPRKLPEWLTVPKGWIAFDGDTFSAAIVASGILETWMKSHSSRGSGWGRRPVAQSILDAFPWPDGFRIEGLPASIYCVDPSPSFAKAAQDLPFEELTGDFQHPSQSELELEIDFPTRRLLLNETLKLYGAQGVRTEGQALEFLMNMAERFRADFSTNPFGRFADKS
ncbi:hypothetical protein SAMN04488030_3056 [Aliiroseovarius halocynthiae]|uniref:Uncharacterized protein n=1 Tax=Aliiroseovarius halocynthiae TaxID=985055 RepID=A0A545SMK2_9RHOB|nr:hypothetical protein [Aliiroseovarius halocynthiae]TQV66193.1 hypothetical protein FIL88_14145 [Aliiroseovarius halocynthiae]SMR82694.1 hypothetical protein SAMN04488030_3056 [Aliiroseovarius halocynthiae]